MGTLPRGIERTASGYRVSVSVGRRSENLRASKRFLSTASIGEMKAWQDEQRVELRKQQPQRLQKGTLTADVEDYVRAVAHMPSLADRKRELGHWVNAYGQLPRSKITSLHVRSQLERWRVQLEWAASTLNHHRGALSHVYTVLDGKQAKNPCRGTAKYQEPDPLPRAVSYAVIQRTFDAMMPSATKARLELMAYTGLSPAELMRVEVAHINLPRRTLIARARRKGKGHEARVIPLTDPAVMALRFLVQHDGLGRWSTSSARKAWRLAYAYARAALVGRWQGKFGERGAVRAMQVWPVNPPRPYDLRHSFLTAAYRESGDSRGVGELAGHSNPRTTRRYTLAAVPSRLQGITTAVDRVVSERRGRR